MNQQQGSAAATVAAVAVAALGLTAGAALLLLGGAAATIGATSHTAAGSGTVLNVEAIPEHARHLASWVIRGGSICPEITPPLVAAQIEQESGWNPDAVAYNPPERGGDAMGIAQFQQATWNHWGRDADGDGVDSPFDPEDAIVVQGTLMCANLEWAGRQVDIGLLEGDPVDLALAAYFCGRGCVTAAGGVPAGGLAGGYPDQVRTRVAAYSLAAAVPAGQWTVPLPAGSYELSSGFGMRWGRLHAGIDLAAPTGTPIRAAADGVVLDAGCSSPRCDIPGSPDMPGCGLRVNVNHGGGVVTRYCHAVALNVTAGQAVTAGQVIGWVGSTGNSSGPHLHFEVHRDAPPATNDTATDPIPFLQAAGLDP
jgi:murein DD-endopeptidase MepM/ murein hydrolase activator NlpD